jgi:predicted secreted protein
MDWCIAREHTRSTARFGIDPQEVDMLRIYVVLVSLVGVVSLGACGSAPSIRLGEQDSGRMIEIRRGDRLEVVLEGSPIMGYQWEWLQRTAGDDPSVILTGEPSFKLDWGGSGRTRFTFETQHAGRTTITLVGRRVDTPRVPPQQTFTVEVIVH